jgi:hypothetical protein
VTPADGETSGNGVRVGWIDGVTSTDGEASGEGVTSGDGVGVG